MFPNRTWAHENKGSIATRPVDTVACGRTEDSESNIKSCQQCAMVVPTMRFFKLEKYEDAIQWATSALAIGNTFVQL